MLTRYSPLSKLTFTKQSSSFKYLTSNIYSLSSFTITSGSSSTALICGINSCLLCETNFNKLPFCTLISFRPKASFIASLCFGI